MAQQLPLFVPATEWTMPDSFPDLKGHDEIAIDLETKDRHLKTLGPGWSRGDGHIIGVGVAVEGFKVYFPMRHEEGPNFDPQTVLDWLASITSYEDVTYVFHNAQYDIGWMQYEGVHVKGKIVDTMVAAPLIDENRWGYGLDALLKEYCGIRKNERLLREAAAAFGVDAKAEMYKLPACYVGGYGEDDADGTLKLWQVFKTLLAKENVESIFKLEMKVTPILIEMRRIGVRVNKKRIKEIAGECAKEEKRCLDEIKSKFGFDIDIWSPDSVAAAFDSLGIEYPRTEKTNQPSFVKEFMKAHEHELPKLINEAREYSQNQSMFTSSFLEFEHEGRIHCEFHQLRSDDGGTITGRFSCSKPNLQQIPARHPIIGPMMRSIFLPEEGHGWGSFDYSSQEPRILTHYANLMNFSGAAEFVEKYNEDPKTDFHQMAADIMEIPRKQAKDINLGLFYGTGVKELSRLLGLSFEDGKALFKRYHAEVPFVKKMADFAMNRAGERGVIRTLLGRKGRFDKWEPNRYGSHTPQSHQDAFDEHGPNIKRAFTYRALNKLVQGSAADQTKAAMVEVYEKTGMVPMLQVHDELCYSFNSLEQCKQIKHIMENCVELDVPSVVDAELGLNWGTAKTNLEDITRIEDIPGLEKGLQ